MDPIELALQRTNTEAFISAKPVEITLVSAGAREKTPSGGWKNGETAPRDPQTFRIIETSMRTTAPTVRSQDGTERQVNFWLLGLYDAAVETGDTWTEGSRRWEVVDVIRTNQYETRAVVVEHGK